MRCLNAKSGSVFSIVYSYSWDKFLRLAFRLETEYVE